MKFELSPAVERAAEAARTLAAQAGAEQLRLTDWLLALTEDEDGKPAQLLARVGVDVAQLRNALLSRTAAGHPAAPSDRDLYSLARNKATAFGGDVILTTEFVLLAVLIADEPLRRELAHLGVNVEAIERTLVPSHYEAPKPAEPSPAFAVTDPTEWTDAARVIDANLNRTRESLRVLDDYCRFVLNDRILTEEVKQLRHAVVEAVKLLPAHTLLQSRNTEGDVGTTVTAGGEYVRRTPREVAAINLKRVQESLRSVEEFGKLHGPEFARRIEQIRYRTYTLERAVGVRSDSRQKLAEARLYVLLTGSQCAAALDWTIAEAAAGGGQIVQLREKTPSDRELLDRATRVRRWTRDAGVLFIVNDRPDVARLVEADGVHLGQDDMPVHAARRILGTDAVIGVSTHTLPQLRRAVLDGADYVGIGPTFPSRTKSFDQLAGLEFIREATGETSLPAFALGGINPSNLGEVLEAGARRIAVSSAVAEADDPQTVARQFRAVLDEQAL